MASYVSAVLPIYEEATDVYIKLLVPLFSPAADLLLDRARRWVWHPSDTDARDAAQPSGAPTLRRLAGLAGVRPPYLMMPGCAVRCAMDFRAGAPQGI